MSADKREIATIWLLGGLFCLVVSVGSAMQGNWWPLAFGIMAIVEVLFLGWYFGRTPR